MNVSVDYEKILEDNLKDEIQWLEQEFEMLFRQKKLNQCYSENDISIGNQILDNIVDTIRSNKNEALLNLLAITLNKIQHLYPEFF
ncbi:MAG: hypothetical protein ACXAEX_21165 [Promethearchaeota archaeon]|jgi:hypothetical protein